MKFSEMPYQRPDMAAAAEETKAFTQKLKNAGSYEELKACYMDHEKARAALRSMMTIAIKHIIHTNQI